jgi:hypothetical protein
MPEQFLIGGAEPIKPGAFSNIANFHALAQPDDFIANAPPARGRLAHWGIRHGRRSQTIVGRPTQ